MVFLGHLASFSKDFKNFLFISSFLYAFYGFLCTSHKPNGIARACFAFCDYSTRRIDLGFKSQLVLILFIFILFGCLISLNFHLFHILAQLVQILEFVSCSWHEVSTSHSVDRIRVLRFLIYYLWTACLSNMRTSILDFGTFEFSYRRFECAIF